MNYLFILLFIFYFILTIASIVSILQEDIYYSKEEKVMKILFVILLPIIASIIELRNLEKSKKIKAEKYEEDVDRNARVYKFVDDHPLDIQPPTNDSAI